jgi:hypothetical protein
MPTLSDPVAGPISQKKTTSSNSARTRFTAGPAAITAIRFQTGWE